LYHGGIGAVEKEMSHFTVRLVNACSDTKWSTNVTDLELINHINSSFVADSIVQRAGLYCSEEQVHQQFLLGWFLWIYIYIYFKQYLARVSGSFEEKNLCTV
jgi:hypothetical protein